MTIKRINCGSGHRYTIDGKKVIGVTTAIGSGIPKPALTAWAARTVARRAIDMSNDDWAALLSKGPEGAFWDLAKTPQTETTKAGVRGTNVHKLAEKLIAGEEVAVPEHLAGHVEAVVAFMDEWQVAPILVEKVIGHYGHGYAGTFDLIADLPDGRRVLFDYKTSKSIWPETAIQLAAYRHASHFVCDDGTELPMSEIGITDSMAVHVRSDGYDVYPLRADLQVFGTFLHALQIARATAGWKAWVGGAISPTSSYLFQEAA